MGRAVEWMIKLTRRFGAVDAFDLVLF